MDSELTLPLAFLAGLAGAGHCWAMCGGLAGGLFLAGVGGQRVYPHLAYHGGRVLAYTLLGALAAALGQAIVLSGGVGRAQGVLYVVAGVLVALAGARVAGWLPLPGFMTSKSPSWPWPIAGFLNGLMPCALVFSLTLKAATAPSVAAGAAWLFAFALGTVPAMLLAGVLAHWLGGQSLIWLRRAAGLSVILLGLQAVLAGAKFFHVMLHL
jgi:sulfite exporter TauE/SafE